MALASFGFSWGFIIVKAVGLPSPLTAALRVTIGAIALTSFALLRRVPFHLSRSVVLAGILFGLHQLLFISASQATSIAVVTLIGALQPLLVAILSRRTVNEEVPLPIYACGLAAVGGVGLVVYANRGSPSTNALGLILSISNLVAFALFFLASKKARLEGAHPVTLTALTMFIALAPIAPFVCAPLAMVNEPPAVENWQLALITLMALVPGNGHLLVNWAHRRVNAALGSLTSALVPVFASIWAFLIFQEPYGPLHIVGTLLTVCSIELARRATADR